MYQTVLPLSTKFYIYNVCRAQTVQVVQVAVKQHVGFEGAIVGFGTDRKGPRKGTVSALWISLAKKLIASCTTKY